MKVCHVTESTGPIRLGKQGENLAREITFDISGWVETYGDGTVVLLVQRCGDTTPYPAAVTQDGGLVTWAVTSADTANAGWGKCELQYLVDEVVVKSGTWVTSVTRSLEDAGEAPDPTTGWVADLLELVKELAASYGLPNAADMADGTILTTLGGEWVLLQIGLEDITEEAF